MSGRFGTPTEPQEQGWPHILAGRTTLISAPTGSGKTLAAFLACIDRLVRKALAGDLQDRTEVLYVSPLKALGNDIQKNLEGPLGEILQMAGERGLLMPEIRTAVRTGDTLMHERRAMLKRPPHILVTTPESLYILLTAEKSRAILRDVETVIVDEIHAVADDKRGAHLALSLERLEALTHRPPVRIGLSATQKPIEEVAHFLTGNGRPRSGHRRRRAQAASWISRSKFRPASWARSPRNEMWDEIYDRLVRTGPSSIARRWCSSTRGGWRSESRIIWRAPGRRQCGRASRQPVAQAASDRGAEIERRRDQGAGGDGIARTGNRYRHRGPGVPDQFSAGDCGRAATRRPLRPLARRRFPRDASSPPRATNCWSARRWCAPSGRAIWIG